MITIFNRRELLITFDMQKQGEIRRILSHGGIDYTVKVVNRKARLRIRRHAGDDRYARREPGVGIRVYILCE